VRAGRLLALGAIALLAGGWFAAPEVLTAFDIQRSWRRREVVPVQYSHPSYEPGFGVTRPREPSELGQPGAPADQSPTDDLPPNWAPRVIGSSLTRSGPSGSSLPYRSGWFSSQVKIIPWEKLPAEQRSREERTARVIADAIRAGLAIQSAAHGEIGWTNERFQFMSSLGVHPGLSVVGHDYLPPASPEASVRWLEARVGRPLAEPKRAQLMELMASYLDERARAQRDVFDILDKAPIQNPSEVERAVFHLADGKAFLVPASRSVEVQRLLEAYESERAAFRDALRRICGG